MLCAQCEYWELAWSFYCMLRSAQLMGELQGELASEGPTRSGVIAVRREAHHRSFFGT